MAGEILALIADAAAGVGDGVHASADVEPAPIVLCVLVGRFDIQVAECLIGACVLLVADPQTVFVELNVFLFNAPEDHAAQSAVADRQRFALPVPRGFRIPKRKTSRGGI